jgi:asparagine synthase (glutamine-hydrolysing)
MCGIAGILNLRESPLEADERSLVSRMAASQHHRGPDDMGVWISDDRRTALGHSRLSILDLSPNGHQPMIGQSGSVLTYNGELYNFHALRQRFPPETLRSTSDTEVLLRCYEADGENCLTYFNGMFAFAIWDARRKELLLARDRVGIKPLYYTTLGSVFAFASEIRALLTLPWVRRELDEEALISFLTFNYLQPPATLFKGIAKLRPGHRLIVDRSGIRSDEPFWRPIWDSELEGNDEDLRRKLLAELQDSIRRQMVSDVPVGVFLSGGVDSSGLVALASEHTTVPVRTYSIGFEGAPAYNELDYARQVAAQYKTNHIERVVRKEELAEFLPKLVDIYDEPLADATSIPIYFISQFARANGSIVVLTGDGSDELFCGYRRWTNYVKVMPWYRRYLKTPGWVRQSVKTLYGMVDHSSPKYELLRQAAAGHEVYWGAGGFKERARQSALHPDYLRRLNGHDPYASVAGARQAFRAAYPEASMRDDVNWLCWNGFTDAVPNFYCYRADRMGMAHSVEVRVPFLDNQIVDLAFSLPSASKLKQGQPKYILKKALEPYLSKELLYRRKMGFCVPIREWADEVFVRYIDEHLKGFCRQTGLFNEAGLREQLRRTSTGNVDYAFGLWNLYFLMIWMRRWILGETV